MRIIDHINLIMDENDESPLEFYIRTRVQLMSAKQFERYMNRLVCNDNLATSHYRYTLDETTRIDLKQIRNMILS